VETLAVLGTAGVLGFLHALEIDHMLAVTTFVTQRPRLAAAAGFGARWGLGHSIAVLLAGGVLLAAGVKLPTRFDAIGEAAVGVMLLGLGVWAWISAGRLHLHTPEEHGGHAHMHHHQPRQTHAPDHEHGITLVGLVHGLAGTSAVVALVPVTLLASLPVGLGYLVMFGVGVTAAMTLFAVAAAYAMRHAAERSLVWGRRAARTVGVLGVVVGMWWVLRATGMIG